MVYGTGLLHAEDSSDGIFAAVAWFHQDPLFISLSDSYYNTIDMAYIILAY